MPGQHKSLNADVLYKIFKYFVAIDEDGPLTLTFLSTYWQNFVLCSPSLWTYIHVGDKIADLDARLETLAVLSAEKPLHIIIKMPYNSFWALRGLMQRCLTLTIDRHSSSGTTRTENQREVLELARVVTDHLLRPFPSTLTQIFWYEAGIPSHFAPTGTDIEFHYREGGERYLDLNRRYSALPPLMITSLPFSIREKFSTNDIHFILSKFWHLQDLQMNASIPLKLSSKDYGSIELPFLQTVSLLFSDEEASGGFGAILSHIQAPILKMATIRRPTDFGIGLGNAFNLITLLRSNGVSLEFQEEVIKSPITGLLTRSLKRTRLQMFESIRYLRIKFSSKFSEPDGNYIFGEINRCVQYLPNLQVFCLCVTRNYIKGLKELSIPRGVLNVSVSPAQETQPSQISDLGGGEPSQMSQSDLSTYFDIRNTPQIDQLEVSFNIMSKWETFWCKELSSARSIIVSDAPIFYRLQLNILIHPRYWSIKLTRLDLGRLGFGSEISRSDSAFSGLQPFTSLTEIRCMPQVLYPLLSRNLLPALKDLILIPSEEGWSFNEFVALLLNMSDPPPLYTLGFLFYPEWTKLYQIIQHLLQRECTKDFFSIKLPGLPHPDLLSGLVTVLRGETPLYLSKQVSLTSQDYVRLSDEEGGSYIDDRGCHYCERSGWTCEEPVEVCERHSLNNLVTITQYTPLAGDLLE